MEDTAYGMLQFGQGLSFPNKTAMLSLITHTAPLPTRHALCLSHRIFRQGILFAADISSFPFLPPSNHTRGLNGLFLGLF